VHIVHVITDLDLGGAEMMLLKVVQASSERYRHSVISLSTEGVIGPKLREAGANVRAFHVTRGRIPGVNAIALTRELRRLRPDVIQGWMYHANVAATAAQLGSLRATPVCWSVRGSLNESDTAKPLTRQVIKMGAWISRLPKSIIYNSARARAEHEAIGYSASKGVVIPNGFDLGKFRPDANLRAEMRKSLGIAPNEIVVGFVGRYHSVKDFGTFLAAAIRVAHESADASFILAGRGVPEMAVSEPNLGTKLAALGGRVRLLGEQANISKLMNAFDLFVICSVSEGFPNVLGEAMATALPCIATDVGDCAGIVDDTGIIVPARSPDNLAKAILQLLNADAAMRSDMGAKARERVTSLYSLKNIVTRYQDQWFRFVHQQ